MLPFVLTLLALGVALAYLFVPLFRAPKGAGSSRARELDRTIERLAQDVALHRLSAEEAAATRGLMERQLLEEIEREQVSLAKQRALPLRHRLGWVGVFLLGLVSTGGLYWFSFGSPGLPDLPIATRSDLDLPDSISLEQRAIYQAAVIEAQRSGNDRLVTEMRERLLQSARPESGPGAEGADEILAMDQEERDARIRSMVDGLAARLEDEPDDLAGWQQLARAYGVLNLEIKEIQALERVIALDPSNLEPRERLARIYMGNVAPGGDIPAEAAEQFAVLFEADKTNVQAAFFSGLYAFQSGDRPTAEKYFDAALTALPPGSAPAVQIKQEIDRLLGR